MNRAVDPLTLESFKTSLTSWLRRRLERSENGGRSPHFETSLYGPINMMLFNWFPHTDNFMVKPQARIREPLDDIGDDEFDEANISVESTGALVPGSGSGNVQGDYMLDWIVAKATESATGDRPILVVEVKRNNSRRTKSVQQLVDYMERFGQQPWYNQLVGFLIENTTVQIYRVVNDVPVARPEDPVEILDDSVLRTLTALVEANWIS